MEKNNKKSERAAGKKNGGGGEQGESGGAERMSGNALQFVSLVVVHSSLYLLW